jgi:tetratricopeptide (TPR) repeat protein
MDKGQIQLVAPLAALLVDVGNYGIKEWLTVVGSLFGTGGSIFGIWRAWRYSKTQIAERLIEHLQDDETKIKEARERIIRHLRRGEPLGEEIEHEFFRGVKNALDDPVQAEKKLASFAEAVASDIRVGQTYLNNANLQLATVFLAKGTIAKSRSEKTVARTAWEDALRCYSLDAEAARYLGELDLAAGDLEGAVDHFGKAVKLGPDDKLLHAETSELLAAFHNQHGSPRAEIEELAKCAPNFADVGAHMRAAIAYARAADIAGQLNRTRQGPRFLRDAFENYRLADHHVGMREMREKLENLGEDVSGLPLPEEEPTRQIPWFWIRLGLELTILGAAAYFLFLTQR